MRNLLILAAFALIAAGCFQTGERKQGPEDRVKDFYQALCSGDFRQAESFCDTLTMGEYIGEFRSAWEGTDEDIVAIAADILSGISVKITDTGKDGQKKMISYTLTSADGQNKEKTAVLKIEEGEWKIEQITDRR